MRRAVQLGTLASAAQLLGAGRALLETSVRHAAQRAQFGRPIGSFQAVKHQLADVAIGLEFARPLLDAAAVAAGDGWATARRDVSAAKVACADAAYRAARTALQVHGAIGYTEEHDLSLWLAKVRALVPAWGSQAEHRAVVLAAVTGTDSGPGDGAGLRDRPDRRAACAPRRGAQPAGPAPGTAGDDGPGYDRVLWRRLCQEIGVAGLALPERYGGAGAGPVETHIVAEELGRDLTATPLLGSAVLAGQLLLAAGDEAACQRLLPGIAGGSVLAAVAWAGPAGHWDPADVRLHRGRQRQTAGGCTARRITCCTATRPTCCWSAARTPDGIGLFAGAPGPGRGRPDGRGQHGPDQAGGWRSS